MGSNLRSGQKRLSMVCGFLEHVRLMGTRAGFILGII